MLQAKPGGFIFLGDGEADQPGRCMAHNASYDFNDDVAVHWTRLTETLLLRAA